MTSGRDTTVGKGDMKLTIRPLTAERWPALEDLFGKDGACNGCWCMYWRIGSRYRNRPHQKNRAEFRGAVERGPAPGLLAFDVTSALIAAALKTACRRCSRTRSLSAGCGCDTERFEHRLCLDVRARGIHDSGSPRTPSPDHAPRPQGHGGRLRRCPPRSQCSGRV